jgi:hypothetical protein
MPRNEGVPGSIPGVGFGAFWRFGGRRRLCRSGPSGCQHTKSQVHVVVQINRFVVAHRTSIARGIVSAKLTEQAGHTTLLRAPVALSAKSGGSCQILNLDLKQLNLVLLGLNVILMRCI